MHPAHFVPSACSPAKLSQKMSRVAPLGAEGRAVATSWDIAKASRVRLLLEIAPG
jgi:hypothetical protein